MPEDRAILLTFTFDLGEDELKAMKRQKKSLPMKLTISTPEPDPEQHANANFVMFLAHCGEKPVYVSLAYEILGTENKESFFLYPGNVLWRELSDAFNGWTIFVTAQSRSAKTGMIVAKTHDEVPIEMNSRSSIVWYIE